MDEIKLIVGLRVSAEEEFEGLDIGEHGMHAYDIPPIGGMFGEAPGAMRAEGMAAQKLAATESH